MPIDITDVSEFTDPIVRPAGSDVRNAASVQASFQGLANRTRFMIPAVGGDDGTGEFAYIDGPRERKFTIPLYDFKDYGDWSAPTNPETGYFLTPANPSVRLLFPISALLTDGMVITGITMSIYVGDALSSVGAKILLIYGRPTFDGLSTPAPVGVGTQGVSTGTGHQFVSIGGLGDGHTVVRWTNVSNRSRDYYLQIIASDAVGGGASDMDKLHGIEITVNDPGPR